jgi:NADH-quinone oxidoreductase subunit F
LWGKPTAINNVETLANIAWIIHHGADAYSAYGTEKSKGTKVFALAGKVARGGLIEVPMGITLKEVVFDIGGGTSSGLEFKAVQIGGPSGGVIPARLADTPVDYESVTKTGAIMGSGGLIVMDESSCMIDIAKFFLNFTQDESCGKCTFCRIGTLRMEEILRRITEGEGREGDVETLEELAQSVKRASLCGLGQTAPNPVLTTIKYFRDEYEEHIYQKNCRAKKCRALITYEIIPEKCPGCGLCAKYCPTGAIAGERKRPYVIDQAKCIRCGLCHNVCRLDAVSVR